MQIECRSFFSGVGDKINFPCYRRQLTCGITLIAVYNSQKTDKQNLKEFLGSVSSIYFFNGGFEIHFKTAFPCAPGMGDNLAVKVRYALGSRKH